MSRNPYSDGVVEVIEYGSSGRKITAINPVARVEEAKADIVRKPFEFNTSLDAGREMKREDRIKALVEVLNKAYENQNSELPLIFSLRPYKEEIDKLTEGNKGVMLEALENSHFSENQEIIGVYQLT